MDSDKKNPNFRVTGHVNNSTNNNVHYFANNNHPLPYNNNVHQNGHVYNPPQVHQQPQVQQNHHYDPSNLPVGFRFVPEDDELITHYLKLRIANEHIPVDFIYDANIYAQNPTELTEEFENFKKDEWLFFTPRDRKYPNGNRPNRAAGNGYWKATGADRAITNELNETIGYRKALVFYEGKPPKGNKTSWIMHEFRVNEPPKVTRAANDMLLDEFVLCRIYLKPQKPEKKPALDNGIKDDPVDDNHVSPDVDTTFADTTNNDNDFKGIAPDRSGGDVYGNGPVNTTFAYTTSNDNDFKGIAPDNSGGVVYVNGPVNTTFADTTNNHNDFKGTVPDIRGGYAYGNGQVHAPHFTEGGFLANYLANIAAQNNNTHYNADQNNIHYNTARPYNNGASSSSYTDHPVFIPAPKDNNVDMAYHDVPAAGASDGNTWINEYGDYNAYFNPADPPYFSNINGDVPIMNHDEDYLINNVDQPDVPSNEEENTTSSSDNPEDDS